MTRQERRKQERQILKDIGKATRGTLASSSGQSLKTRINEVFPHTVKKRTKLQTIAQFLKTFGHRQVGFRKIV